MNKSQKDAFDDDFEEKIPEHIPLNKPMTEQMEIDLVANKKGDMWLFHTQPFDGYLDYIEYEADQRKLTFITKSGRLNEFGIEIGPKMHKRLVKRTSIDVIRVEDKKIHDFAPIPLIIRQTYH